VAHTRFGQMIRDLGADFRTLAHLATLKDLYHRIGKHEVTTLSTSFAYFWVFAIPPLLILVSMIAVLINKVTNVPIVANMRDLIRDRVDPDFQALLLRLVDQAVTKVGSGTASIGVLLTTVLALWSASSGIGILIQGFNRSYDLAENRSWVHKKLLTLGLTLMLVSAVNIAFTLLLFGDRIGAWMGDKLGFGSIFVSIWTTVRWPVAIVGMMFALSVVYWAGPNLTLPYRITTVGAMIATILWLGLVGVFGLYLSFSNPGSAYGVAGSVIVLLVFLNLTGTIFFLGGEIDAYIWQARGHQAPTLPDA